MAVATNVELPRLIVRRTCDSTTAIPLGTLMKLEDDNTVVAGGTADDPFGGITTEEKVATETDIITIGCAMDGVWDIDTLAAAVTAGQMVNMASTANAVDAAVDADFEKGSIVGKAEETADGSGGKIRVRLMGF